MKKIVFFAVILAVIITSCKKEEEKSTDLNYNDSNPIVMALSGPDVIPGLPSHYFDHKIQVSSDYDISYSAINPSNHSIITMSSDGYIHGKEVGTAQVKISNGHEDMTVDVDVKLFIEPTFEFGCNTNRIRALYGTPSLTEIVDTVLVYRYTSTNGYYSYTCAEMDFVFYEGEYFESLLYIVPKMEGRLNEYLKDNFTLFDTIVQNNTQTFVYRNKIDPSIFCGKYPSGNQYNEICLFYIRISDEKSLANVLKMCPRSSKLRY